MGLYEAGKFEEALQELRSHPDESAQYFYNVGTVFLRMNRPGEAVAYLQKANSLRPHDAQTQTNLQVAESSLSRTLGSERLDPASSGIESMADRVSMQEVRGALGFLAFIVVLFWLRAYLKTRSIKRTVLQPGGMIGFVGFAITLGLYTTERLASSNPPAFVIEKQVVRSGPGDNFVQMAQMEPGQKIRLLGPEDKGWKQVRYSADSIGWIKASSLLLL